MSTAKSKRFSHIKAHGFRGRQFKMIWRAPKNDDKLPPNYNYFGECDWSQRKIKIYPSSDGLELLDTVLEEGIHASFYDIEDEAVREAVKDIRALLERMGIEISFNPKV